MDRDGYFAIVSRTKDVINTAGFKVWPAKSRRCSSATRPCAWPPSSAFQTATAVRTVKACVVLKDEYRRQVTESDLRRYCRERLTPYKVPRIVEFCDELPMTVTGKVLRHELHKRMG